VTHWGLAALLMPLGRWAGVWSWRRLGNPTLDARPLDRVRRGQCLVSIWISCCDRRR